MTFLKCSTVGAYVNVVNNFIRVSSRSLSHRECAKCAKCDGRKEQA